jgi:hypothetical protein
MGTAQRSDRALAQAGALEPWKALAAIVGAAALMVAAALALSHWHVPQTINASVHLVKP